MSHMQTINRQAKDLKEKLACLRQVCEETERLVEKADSTPERIQIGLSTLDTFQPFEPVQRVW